MTEHRHSIVHGENGPQCATCAALPLFARPARCPQEREVRKLAAKWRDVRERVQHASTTSSLALMG